MSEQATAISEHEAAHAPHADHGGGAADPPSGMHEWWKTPASLIRKPVAVDPAIYGIDASDVGGEVGGNAAAVAETFAQVARDHVGPTSLDAYIGIEGAGSAQAAPKLGRSDHMRASEHNRLATMSAQMMLAAKKIEGSIQAIDDTLATPIGARSPDAMYEHLESLVEAAVAERARISLVFQEQTRAALKVPIGDLADALKHLGRASHDLQLAEVKVKNFASRHQLTSNPKKLGAAGVKRDVEGVEAAFKTEVDISGVKNVKETEGALQRTAVEQSLEGLDESAQALQMAVLGADPQNATQEVMPGLLSNFRMLSASIDEHTKPSKKMLDRARNVLAVIDMVGHAATRPDGFRAVSDQIAPVLKALVKKGSK